MQSGSDPTLLHNFSGLRGLDTAKIAGVRVHPPDQGLCVGHDASIAGNPEVEFEMINLVVAEYNTSGVVQKSALMPSGKESLNAFFNEPGAGIAGRPAVAARHALKPFSAVRRQAHADNNGSSCGHVAPPCKSCN